MKKYFSTLIIVLIFTSCSGIDSRNYFQEVGYIYTTIANVNDRSISFSNGMTIRTNRIIIAVNSTPVLLIIENYTGAGYFYLRNSKINFSGSGDIEMMGMMKGRIQYVQSIDQENRIIRLADDSDWFIPRDEDWNAAKDWLTTPEIILPDNKPQQGEFFIHTVSAKSVLAVNVDRSTNQ
ncbi:MAG: hypothetical protein QY331_16190 [Melioribacteraceae bacterium]|nr:MAG: hypothetical protein QY331_16190 [Melioribacteraceae bacterium]